MELLTWRDAIDILAVAVVIYNLLLLIRGTRAVQMLLGIVFVGVVYYIAQLVELPTLQKMLESLLIVLPFAIIVLFQQEIRRALANFGRNPLWGLTKQQKVVSSFGDIVLAATTLSYAPDRRPDRHRAPAGAAQLCRERHRARRRTSPTTC